MTPDPFRALDRIDPPDQWDEITRRARQDGVDLDLDALPAVRPRRRAAALVAAAAVLALVGGAVVATATHDGDDDGVTADEGPTGVAAGMNGPCPFVVVPGPLLLPVDPGETPVPPPIALIAATGGGPAVDWAAWTHGSWGTITRDGVGVAVTVYADARLTWPLTDRRVIAQLVDDAGGKQLLISGTGVLEGSSTCRTVEVSYRAALDDADAAVQRQAIEAGDDPEDLIDLEPYVARHTRRVEDLIADVRLVAPGPDADVGEQPDPCADRAGATPPPTQPAEPPLPFTFRGETAAGRGLGVEVTDEDGGTTWLRIDGSDGSSGGSRPDGPGQLNWTTEDGVGIVVGWRPPDAVATGAVRPDGTLATDGLVLSPGGTLFLLPDVGLVAGRDGEDDIWPIVHCDAAGHAITGTVEPETPTTSRPAPTTTTTTTTTSAPAGTPMTWEGQLVDGRTYRVEVDGDIVRALVDGQEVNPAVDTEVPAWPVDPGNAPSSIGFELSPTPAGSPPDWVLVGARPPGAVETYVEGPDGDMVAVRSLTLSPDGRLYALHGLELDFMEVGDPWPVVHTTADGEVVELP